MSSPVGEGFAESGWTLERSRYEADTGSGSENPMKVPFNSPLGLSMKATLREEVGERVMDSLEAENEGYQSILDRRAVIEGRFPVGHWNSDDRPCCSGFPGCNLEECMDEAV